MMSTFNSTKRSSSPPTMVHHQPTLFPKNIPTPALVSSVAGASHYSAFRRSSAGERTRASFGRGMSEEDLTPGRKRVLDDLNELFCARPTPQIFERSWSLDAVFEDPLSKCFGFSEYAAQWYALPKIFSKSVTLSSHPLASTTSPNRLVYLQTQEYTFRFIRVKKVVQSLVVVDLDDDDMIIKLEDKWNGEDQPTRWGALTLRRLNAWTLPWFVRVKAPKEKSH